MVALCPQIRDDPHACSIVRTVLTERSFIATITGPWFKNVAINCFSYEWRANTLRENSAKIGKCDYCGSQEGRAGPMSYAVQPVQNLLKLYVLSDDSHGEPLIGL